MFFDRNLRFVFMFVISARNQVLTNIYAVYIQNLLNAKLFDADEVGMTHHLHTMSNQLFDEFYQKWPNEDLRYDPDGIDVTDTLMVRSLCIYEHVDPLTSCYVSMLLPHLCHIYV